MSSKCTYLFGQEPIKNSRVKRARAGVVEGWVTFREVLCETVSKVVLEFHFRGFSSIAILHHSSSSITIGFLCVPIRSTLSFQADLVQGRISGIRALKAKYYGVRKEEGSSGVGEALLDQIKKMMARSLIGENRSNKARRKETRNPIHISMETRGTIPWHLMAR
ncbi:unnamed protein product [Microthlaspi erraticum]|uniref:Uncharacterized protein n=1 Tax=Microthlaspi erraticum TaxID=1685480 RepID=A0A6D2JF53_9BRAS|nr:unnamed protein product [Microthlaspi erraticum]